jgi:hypothetical protein
MIKRLESKVAQRNEAIEGPMVSNQEKSYESLALWRLYLPCRSN